MRRLLISLSVVFAIYTPLKATVYYVNSAQIDNSGDGTSWFTAKKYLQDAIHIAHAGDEIWVAKGTYYPDEGISTANNNRRSTFAVKDNVKIFGGFFGTESVNTERDWVVNKTILSGEIQQNNSSFDNSFHIITASDLSNNASIDGFLIINGYASGNIYKDTIGGGLLINTQNGDLNSVQIANCIFENNYAEAHGGAIFMSASNGKVIDASINNTNFFNNKASFEGGAIYAAAIDGSNFAKIEHCNFFKNTANNGGALQILIDNNGEASLKVSSCIFNENSSFAKAGALNNFVINGISNTQIADCQFIKNKSGGNAGAMMVEAKENGINNISINKCDFIQNSTNTNYSGGAICIFADASGAENNPKINKCKFSQNWATFGGAIANITELGKINLEVKQSLFTKNKSNYSAAIDYYLKDGNIVSKVINCTITENNTENGSAIETVQDGEGQSAVQIVNTITWNNANNPEKNDIYFGSPTDALIHSSVSNIDCTSLNSGICINNFYDQDPLFIDPQNENYSLKSCSPAINAGTSNLEQTEIDQTDLLNNGRIFEQSIDMGAFESQINHGFTLAQDPISITQNLDNPNFQLPNCIIVAKIIPKNQSTSSSQITLHQWSQSAGFANFAPRYYEIIPENNTINHSANITLFYSQADFDAYNANPENELKLPINENDADGISNISVVKYEGLLSKSSSQAFQNLPNSISNISNSDIKIEWLGQYWSISFDVEGFTGYLLTTESSNPLPIKLISFDGKSTSNGNELKWKTSSEKNFSHFEIERSSPEASDALTQGGGNSANKFEKIGEKNSDESQNYEFLDRTPPPGRFDASTGGLYRLKMIDKDGSFEYSKIIYIKNNNENNITISPNPSTDFIVLNGILNSEIIEIKFFDFSGKLLKTLNNYFDKIEIKNLPSQMYIIDIELINGYNKQIKFIKY